MRRSQTITVQIGLPWRQVYAFLAEPANYPRWAAVTPGSFRQVGESEWEGEMFGATRRAVERSFAMPLVAAGFKDAKVVARFPTDGTDDPSYLDLSTPYNQAIEQAERLRAQGK